MVRQVSFRTTSGAILTPTIVARARGQLQVVIAELPIAIVDEQSYQLYLDDIEQEEISLTLRNYISRRTVMGVLLANGYTRRVNIDKAGVFTNLRAQPKVTSVWVGKLRNGDQVDILRDDWAGWYYLRIYDSGEPARIGLVGWTERWLVDNQPPPRR
jgi:hypothetical protein